MAQKQTSDELSALASRVLRMGRYTEVTSSEGLAYNRLLADAKRLAGSVLSQDEKKGLLHRLRKAIGRP